ncbi:MAG: PhoX family phosphatase [Sporichthyaceae bacterium]|nr:PhoX family phosphatase [Sporichthyaceae bacterium]
MPESSQPTFRRELPLLPVHGNRSRQTCLYRCGNACDHPVPNTSGNPYFGDILAESISRRGILKAGALTGLVVGAGGLASAAPVAAAEKGTSATASARALTFTPVPPNKLDMLLVPNQYDYRVVVRWGDPILAGAPAFDVHNQTADAQAMQFGYNCDYLSLMPFPDDEDRALLFSNHEYTDEQLMFPGVTTAAGTTEEQKRIAMAAHGLSVVEIRRVGDTGAWRMSKRRTYNRRFTASTPFKITGPAAGSPLLQTAANPSGTRAHGTLNNCAGGTTPWGTALSGEENFNQYFGASSAVPDPEGTYKRYGIPTSGASERRWETIDPRFDVAKERNEPHRFGWIVEVDPFDPDSMPRKRTALGRFKHEGATTTLAEDGRVVAYMGDDERFDYIYKFISKNKFRKGTGAAARRHNMTLLDEGDLYVAQFTGDSPTEINGRGTIPSDLNFDGRGRWIPLVKDGVSMVPGRAVDWVLVFTRLAADEIGKADPTLAPTKMDRPEDIERNPVTGRVYAALTNNSLRTTGPNEANPLTQSNTAKGLEKGNRNGHVIEWREVFNDAGSLAFGWSIFLIAGEPLAPETYFAGYDKTQVSPISSPDNVAFDPVGNLWIATDGNVLGSNDGLFATRVRGEERGHLKQFLTVPIGAETCGPLITGDHLSVFVAVQHPGETDGSTFDKPSSTWPDKLPTGGYPRPSVANVFKSTGPRRIGT